MNKKMEAVSDLLDSAFAGGSAYWIESAEMVKPAKGNYWPEMILNGATLCIHVDDITRDETTYYVNKASTLRGLATMKEKYPNQWNDYVTGQWDAITGDVFLQCCVFDEAPYG